MRHLLPSFLAIILLALLASQALAQPDEFHESESGGGNLFYDPVVAPLILPAGDDFLPPPADATLAETAAPSPLSLGAYVDVTGDLKLFTFAPWYTFSERFAAKVRVPWVFKRTLNYLDFLNDRTVEASAGGLGDISVDAEYTHRFAAPGRVLRLQASVKLPTGDEEKLDGEYPVPLGTGSVDLLARAQYALSTSRTGLLVTGLYRRNSAGETISQWIDPADPSYVDITTSRTTQGHQFVGAAFARRRMTESLWLHLGVGVMLSGDGQVEQETRYGDGTTDSFDYALVQKATMVDLFPGFSWQLGKLAPYLGVRIPVVTSYDADYIEADRDLAVTLQLSYRPERLF
jgi:hypothetical protein